MHKSHVSGHTCHQRSGRRVHVLEGRIDHSRVVQLVRRGGHLGLVKDYLSAVQKNNLVRTRPARCAVSECCKRRGRYATALRAWR